jgi:hypothetical protein
VGISSNPNFETSTGARLDHLARHPATHRRRRRRDWRDHCSQSNKRCWAATTSRSTSPVGCGSRRATTCASRSRSSRDATWSTSATDGTLEPSDPSPFLLYGYGSYEISIDPPSRRCASRLLDRGVIFAIAHIRGGGEMGRSWYEMGRLAQKPTTFSDFVAVARCPRRRGVDHAATAGRARWIGGRALDGCGDEPSAGTLSSGGRGGALRRRRDHDARRLLPLTAGEWEEWGNPEASATSYRTMKSYSPYDNVRATQRRRHVQCVYPHLFAVGGSQRLAGRVSGSRRSGC